MKNIIIISAITFLSGCASLHEQALREIEADKANHERISQACYSRIKIQNPKPANVSEEEYQKHIVYECHMKFVDEYLGKR